MTNQGITEFLQRGKLNALPKFYQCGICSCYHPLEWDGDCRDDANRFAMDQLDDRFGPYGWDEVEMPDGLEMHDNSCGECGHPYRRDDETHYPECSRINVA